MRKQFVVASMVFGLTACGAGVEKNAEYQDVNQLGAAYESATGVACTETETDDDLDEFGWVYNNCGAHGQVMLFASDAKRDEIKRKNPLDEGQRWVQGKNWIVKAAQYDAEKVHEALGGELLES
ncbi:hypothetical protein PTW37_10295 [Arthrobacter agilis]|uniref:hypothetical protein n=1 Tax=Arthrobacter agilis TaxID=37921 RepID=UPI0023662CD6|nr:hypothetical protein [Arthrobacter agilis]WDF32264.1 hypothetical protein PTW37_10295 [Arthrobacter agilis]